MSFYDSAFPIFTYPFSVYFTLLISTNFKLYFIFIDQWKRFILKTRGKTFYFLFYSLCPIYQLLVHVECQPVVRFHPFLLPLVRACSHTSPKCPSMFWTHALNSFTLFCSKGRYSSLFQCLNRPTCLVFNLLTFASLCFFFRKLPGDTPPLFHFVSGCFTFRFWCCAFLLLFIFVFLSYPFWSSCFVFAFSF